MFDLYGNLDSTWTTIVVNNLRARKSISVAATTQFVIQILTIALCSLKPKTLVIDSSLQSLYDSFSGQNALFHITSRCKYVDNKTVIQNCEFLN